LRGYLQTDPLRPVAPKEGEHGDFKRACEDLRAGRRGQGRGGGEDRGDLQHDRPVRQAVAMFINGRGICT